MPRDLARSPRTGSPSGVGVNAEVEIADTAVLLALSGPNNELLKVLGEESGVGVGLRGNSILLAGDPERVALAERFLGEAAGSPQAAERARRQRLHPGAPHPARRSPLRLRDLFDDVVLVTPRHRPITPEGARAEAIHRGDPHARSHVRHRAGRHRQDVPGHGDGGARRCSSARTSASSWRAPRSRPARSSAFCRAISRRR